MAIADVAAAMRKASGVLDGRRRGRVAADAHRGAGLDRRAEARQDAGRVGNFHGTTVHELAALAYVEWFNQHRLHSELGDIPPAEFEADYYARQRAQAEVNTPTRT